VSEVIVGEIRRVRDRIDEWRVPWRVRRSMATADGAMSSITGGTVSASASMVVRVDDSEAQSVSAAVGASACTADDGGLERVRRPKAVTSVRTLDEPLPRQTTRGSTATGLCIVEK